MYLVKSCKMYQMENDTRYFSNQIKAEMTSESLTKLRKDVTDFLAEVDDFFRECGYVKLESNDKIEGDIEDTKLQDIENNRQMFPEVKTKHIPVMPSRQRVHEVYPLESRRQIEIEAQLVARREDEKRMRERIVQRMKTQSNRVNAPIETPVPVESKNRKRKLELVSDHEPSMEGLVLPVKRKVVIDLRQSVGNGFKTEADDGTSVSVLSRTCAPAEDLRQVLQRRRGCCY